MADKKPPQWVFALNEESKDVDAAPVALADGTEYDIVEHLDSKGQATVTDPKIADVLRGFFAVDEVSAPTPEELEEFGSPSLEDTNKDELVRTGQASAVPVSGDQKKDEVIDQLKEAGVKPVVKPEDDNSGGGGS